MNPTERLPSVSIVGAGRLARALLPAIVAARYPIEIVASRHLASARSATRGLPGATPSTDLGHAAKAGAIVLLAVPDREIAGVARELALVAGATWKRRIVLHHAGALGPDVLRPLSRAGAAVGVLHPLQVLSGPGSNRWLRDSRARIEGDPPARREARRLARALGLVPLRLPATLSAAQRSAYHAAASLVSNDLLALLSLAMELLQDLGLSRPEARRALLPLSRGTLFQVEHEGLPAGLSGPAVRGDVETVAAHLRRLRRVSADAAEAHRLLALRLVELAERWGPDPPAGTRGRLGKLARTREQPAG